MPWQRFADTFPQLALARMRRKPCRRLVRKELKRLASAQRYGDNTPQAAARLAATCRDCGRCPKFAAGIRFMLPGPRG